MSLAFISHSSQDRFVAHEFATALRRLGISPFLAHDDLPVATSWREELLRNLQNCEIFVALLSRDFRESEWCAMECGFILSRKEVIILPYSIDGTLPFGFLSAIQGGFIDIQHDLKESRIRASLRKAINIQNPGIFLDILGSKLATFTTEKQGRTYIEVMNRQRSDFTEQQALHIVNALSANHELPMLDRKFRRWVLTSLRALQRKYSFDELDSLIESLSTEAITDSPTAG